MALLFRLFPASDAGQLSRGMTWTAIIQSTSSTRRAFSDTLNNCCTHFILSPAPIELSEWEPTCNSAHQMWCISAFERLDVAGYPSVLLDVQYRAHARLYALTSEISTRRRSGQLRDFDALNKSGEHVDADADWAWLNNRSSLRFTGYKKVISTACDAFCTTHTNDSDK